MSRILDYSLRRIKIIPRTDEYLEKYNVIVSRIIASVPPPASLPTAGTLGRHGPVRARTDPSRFSWELYELSPQFPRIISSNFKNNLEGKKIGKGRMDFASASVPRCGVGVGAHLSAITSQQQLKSKRGRASTVA